MAVILSNQLLQAKSMSYQVLARKWRPKNFNEMVGQAHVLRALINALDQERLHHAYLFTGTRGVGKTTIARILAKSLNCLEGVSSSPCGVCDACTSIDEGRFIDLIEVDAASRTKVEDTREILDNVQYAPTQGRYKVYLVDEVHMLSNHSFNALLKTLEEPPPHVKFLLATTDPQKLPATILSRCLQFSLTRMPADMIDKYLGEILQKEALQFEPQALRLLAQAADGSMRDALSLLDQSIAYGEGEVKSDDVASMLGYIDRDYIYKLLNALHAEDASALMAQIKLLSERVADFTVVIDALISTLHQLSITQVIPDAVEDLAIDKTAMQDLAAALSAEDLQLYYQIALHGKRDLPYAPDTRSGFEMTMLRMLAFKPVEGGTVAAGTTGASGQIMPGNAAANVKASVTPTPATAQDSRPAEEVKHTAHHNTENQVQEPPAEFVSAAPAIQVYDLAMENWPLIVKQLPINGVTAQLAQNAAVQTIHSDGDSHSVELSLAKEHAMFESYGAKLEKAVSDYYGFAVKIKVTLVDEAIETPAVMAAKEKQAELDAAKQSIQNDPMVKALQDNFDATIIEDSIKPINH